MADGDLVFNSVNLKPTDKSCNLDIVSGWWWEPATVRGEAVTIPAKSGQLVTTGFFVKDHRIVRLHGYVHGTGATLALRQQAFQSKMATILALFDPTAADANLVATNPYGGLASGTKTLACRGNEQGPVVINQIVGTFYAELDAQLVARGSPPDWT